MAHPQQKGIIMVPMCTTFFLPTHKRQMIGETQRAVSVSGFSTEIYTGLYRETLSLFKIRKWIIAWSNRKKRGRSLVNYLSRHNLWDGQWPLKDKYALSMSSMSSGDKKGYLLASVSFLFSNQIITESLFSIEKDIFPGTGFLSLGLQTEGGSMVGAA